MEVNQITLSIYTIGWYSLVPIVIILSLIFLYLYKKDKDKRKLMFAIGILPSTISFIICAMDLHRTDISSIIINLYNWGPVPIIVAAFIAVNESIITTKKFDYLFNIFIAIFLITLFLAFVPVISLLIYTTMYIFLTVEILLIGSILLLKKKELSNLMFILSILCFIIAGTTMSSLHPDLSIFAYFMAFTFFAFVFQVSYPRVNKNKSNLDSYFSLEKRLENAELALKDNDAKYKALFEHSLSWVFIIDFQGNVLEVNEVVLKSLGLNKEHIFGLNISRILKEEDIPRAQKIIQEIIQTGHQTKPAQYELRNRDGKQIWLEMEASLIYKDGKPYAIQGIGRDITEQKLAEEELKSSEEQFKKLFEYAPDAFYTYDFEGNFIDGNKEAERLIGYRKEELIGKNMLEVNLLPEDQIENVIESIELNIKGEATGLNEITLLNKDGDEIYVETSSIPLKIKDKNLVLGIAHDITERKKAQQQIDEWKNRYEAAVTASGHLLYDWNCETNDVKYGGDIENILGYTSEEMKGGLIKWVELIHPEDRDTYQNTVKKMVENAITQDFEYRVQKKDGNFITVEDTGQFIVDDSGNINSMIGFVKDITNRRRVEEAIKKKSANLKRFAKLAVGREKKMIELKSRLKELEDKEDGNKIKRG